MVYTNHNWLVVDLPLWKIWKSVGIIISNIWNIIKMFQSTNQIHTQQSWDTPGISTSALLPFPVQQGDVEPHALGGRAHGDGSQPYGIHGDFTGNSWDFTVISGGFHGDFMRSMAPHRDLTKTCSITGTCWEVRISHYKLHALVYVIKYMTIGNISFNYIIYALFTIRSSTVACWTIPHLVRWCSRTKPPLSSHDILWTVLHSHSGWWLKNRC